MSFKKRDSPITTCQGWECGHTFSLSHKKKTHFDTFSRINGAFYTHSGSIDSESTKATHVTRTRERERQNLLVARYYINLVKRVSRMLDLLSGSYRWPSVDRLKRKRGKEKKGGGRKRERETCRFHSGLIDAQHPRGAIKIPVSHSIIFFTLQPWPVIHSPVYLAYSPIDLLALRCVPCPGIDKISKLGRSYGLDMVGSRRRKKGTWRNSRFVS